MKNRIDSPHILNLDMGSKRLAIGCGTASFVFAAGIFGVMIAGLLGFIGVQGQSRWGLLALTPLWLIALLVGKKLVTGQTLTRLSFNSHSRTLTETWEGLRGSRERVRSLDEFSAVSITKDWRSSRQGGSSTTYPVRLEPRKGQDVPDSEKLRFCAPVDYIEARRYAERVARFSRLPLIDSSSREQTVVRQPDELDESLGERARRTGATVELPEPPENMRSIVHAEGRSTVIDLPPYELRLGCYVPLVFGILWTIPWVGALISAIEAPGELSLPRSLYIVGIAVLGMGPLALMVFMLLLAKFRRQRLTVGPGEMELEAYRVLPRKVTRVAVNDVEELVMEPATLINPRTIVARTDSGTLELRDMTMSEHERDYLFQLLRAILSS